MALRIFSPLRLRRFFDAELLRQIHIETQIQAMDRAAVSR
jgi:hypothetical protein